MRFKTIQISSVWRFFIMLLIELSCLTLIIDKLMLLEHKKKTLETSNVISYTGYSSLFFLNILLSFIVYFFEVDDKVTFL